MVGLDVGHQRSTPGPGEEAGVALVGLEHEHGVTSGVRRCAECGHLGADHEARIQPGPAQRHRCHRGRRGLPVRPRDRHQRARRRQRVEGLAPSQDRQTAPAGLDHLDVVVAHRARHDDELGVAHLVRRVTDRDRDAAPDEAFRCCGRDGVGPGDPVTAPGQHRGDRRHPGAADRHQVHVARPVEVQRVRLGGGHPGGLSAPWGRRAHPSSSSATAEAASGRPSALAAAARSSRLGGPSSSASTSATRRSVSSAASSTSTAAPASTNAAGVRTLVVTRRDREGDQHRREAHHRELCDGRPAGPAHRHVRGLEDQVHALLIADEAGLERAARLHRPPRLSRVRPSRGPRPRGTDTGRPGPPTASLLRRRPR